jgi:hypothetical protein
VRGKTGHAPSLVRPPRSVKRRDATWFSGG